MTIFLSFHVSKIEKNNGFKGVLIASKKSCDRGLSSQHEKFSSSEYRGSCGSEREGEKQLVLAFLFESFPLSSSDFSTCHRVVAEPLQSIDCHYVVV